MLAADRATDLALLETRGPRVPPAVKLHRGEPVAIGREVAFLGFPYSDCFTPPLAMATRGIVGNRYRLGDVDRYVIDALCAEGMSGGPLFLAENGVVVGQVGSRFDPGRTRARLRGASAEEADRLPPDRTPISFATPAAEVRSLLARAGFPT